MRALGIVVAGFVLAGCVSKPVPRSVWTVTPAVAAMPTGGTAWRDWARRTNDEIRASGRSDPLAEVFLSERVAYAAEVDARRMTPEQFDAVQNRRLVDLAGAEKAQNNAAADAMMAAGVGLMSQRPAPAFDNSPSLLRQPVTCDSRGISGAVRTSCY